MSDMIEDKYGKERANGMIAVTSWYHVFSARPDTPDLSALRAICRTRADDNGWYQVHFPLLQANIEVNRWLAGVDDIRAELNTWAAWVEVNSGPELSWLMHHLVSAAQLFAWEMNPRSTESVAFSEMLCNFLCDATDGVYQIDGKGFFKADGTLLVRESP
jgi:hypothetical protein